VTLHNGGDEAYRPEIYGEAIIFKRTIYAKNNQSTQALYDQHGREVFQGKNATEEKKLILDHFNLQVDNPATVLQQEEAKNFFAQSDERQLYDFFMRATMLKDVKEQLMAATPDLIAAEDNYATAEKDRERVEKEIETLVLKAKKLKTISEGSKEDQANVKWKLVSVYRGQMEKHKQTAGLAKKRLETSEASFQEAKVKLDKVQRELEGLNRRHREDSLTRQLARGQQGQREKTHAVAAQELMKAKKALQALEEEYAAASRELQSLNKVMRLRRASGDGREEEKKAKLRQMLDNLQAEEEAKTRELDHAKEAEGQKAESKTQCRLALGAAQSAKDTTATRVADLEWELRDAQTSECGQLSRFGQGMEALVMDIDRFVHARRFQRAPIGPIGRHVHLIGGAAADRNLADLLQIELGARTLSAFLVGNQRDHHLLLGLIQKHRLPFPPRVCIMPLVDRRHDIRDGQPNVHPTVLDFLSFDDDNVFNYVVEQTRCEKTLVVSQERAEALFERAENVPANVMKAITRDFYKFTPSGRGSTYASSYINRVNMYGQNVLISNPQVIIQRVINAH